MFDNNEWNWHVRDVDGGWVGQFRTKETADAWIAKHPGYTLSNEGPAWKKKQEAKA